MRDTSPDFSPTRVTDQKRRRSFSCTGEKGKCRRNVPRSVGDASPYESEEEEEEGGREEEGGCNVYKKGEERGGDMAEGTSGGAQILTI